MHAPLQWAVCAIVLTVLWIGTARAELSGHVAALSDYRFRGISQSDGGPAAQASATYDHSSGLFAGLFASTVNFNEGFQADFETFVQGGLARRIGPDFSWEIGIGHYAYARANADWNYSEPFAGVTWRDVNVRVHYAPDYINRGARATYVEVNATHPLSERIALFAHAGYWRIAGGSRAARARSQFDVRVGVTFDLGVASLEVSGVATDVESEDCPAPPRGCRPTVVIAISRSF